MSKPLISLCMIVRDSDKMLKKCLDSVKGIVEEIIIVDTGSKDNTVKIAEDYGAKVSYFEWINDFSAARNYALKQAYGDWVFVMDDDFELLPEGKDVILKELMSAPIDNAFRVKIQGTDMTPIHSIRLWRNGLNIKYSRPIHEIVDLNDAIVNIDPTLLRTLDATIFHHEKIDDDRTSSRSDRNFLILKASFEKDPTDHATAYYLGTEFNARGYLEEAAQCFLKTINHFSRITNERKRTLKFSILPYAYLKLIATFGAMRQYDHALSVFDQARAIYSDFPELYYVAALVCFEKGDLPMAVECFKLIKTDQPGAENYSYPVDLEVKKLLGLGNALMHNGENIEAMQILMHAQQIAPNDHRATAILEKIKANL